MDNDYEALSRDAIIDHLIKLRDNWWKCEKTLNKPIYGECAEDLDELIEKAGDSK